MTKLFAQPYDMSAYGFYFESVEGYNKLSKELRNSYGEPVEEFEIQFIDGEYIDAKLFSALGVYQCDLGAFFNVVGDWEYDDKVRVIIAVGEVGYKFDLEKDVPDQFDIELYEMNSLRDLAIQFVEEGFLGEILDSVHSYLNYDAIARDLGMDYCEIRIADINYVYRCD